MKNLLHFTLFALFLLIGCGSSKEEKAEPVVPKGADAVISVFVTTPTEVKKLSPEPNIAFNSNASAGEVVEVKPAQAYQTIEGFGVAMTGSAAVNLQKLSAAARLELLQELYGPKGLHFKAVRLTMGASDFSPVQYTYNDLPTGQTDLSLAKFSLGQDLDHVVPMMKELLAVNPGVFMIASPWSPPAWMKTTGIINGGALKPEYFDVYADYFVKYLQAMAANGINIQAATCQNEPRTLKDNYPTMGMTPTEQIRFIKLLGPKLQAAGLATKILTGDNNWNGTDYSQTVLNDAGTRPYVLGAAFHGYAGSPAEMGFLQNMFPDKGMYFTEYTGVTTAPSFADNLKNYTRTYVVENCNNGAKTVIFWNLALDQNGNPQIKGGTTCRGLVTINNSTLAITRSPEYYVLGQASKFVKKGAKRIQSARISGADIMPVAFLNPDGEKVVLVLNNGNQVRNFDVRVEDKKFSYALPAGAVATFTWK